MSTDVPKRSGFRLFDLLVLGFIAGVLILLCMSSTSTSRDSARRYETINNLKQLGIGLHYYHDAANSFPSENRRGTEGEAIGGPVSFYRALVPYIESSNGWPVDSVPFKVFVCASRHTIASGMGPVTDFGYQSPPPAILKPFSMLR